MTTPDTSEQQSREIDRVCDFIARHCPELIQCDGDSRWTHGHVLFRFESTEPGMYAYMVGPLENGRLRLHLLPLYSLKELRDKHLKAFLPFENGNNCICFERLDELPLDALAEILEYGTPRFKAAMTAKLGPKNPPLALL